MSRTKNLHTSIRWSWRQTKKWIARLLDDMNTSNTVVLAAGISYFCSLAFFPLFAAGLAIASIVIAPHQVIAAVENVNTYLPSDIAALVASQLEAQSGRYEGNIIIATIAIAISLFGASAAVQNTIRSLNVLHGVKETRNIVKIRALSFLMLVCALLLISVVLSLLVVDRYMVAWGIPELLVEVMIVIRWPVLVGLMILAFTTLYHYGPNRPRAEWRWINWGAIAATLLWLVVTLGLFAYTRFFPTFSQSYTLFAGIIVLMMWFNLSALALLIGGHINQRLLKK